MKLQRRHSERSPVSLTPLIDMVFVVLIFFMLAGRVSAPMPFEARPPESEQQRRAGDSATTVYVAVEGLLAVGRTTTTLDKLAGLVRDRRGDDGLVRVRADEDAAANRVIAVLAALRNADIHRVRLLTRPAENR